MRLVTAAVTYLTITWLTVAACPASANEAFIAQLTSKATATEQSSADSMKTMLSAAMLALPLQPKAVNSPAANAATAGGQHFLGDTGRRQQCCRGLPDRRRKCIFDHAAWQRQSGHGDAAPLKCLTPAPA